MRFTFTALSKALKAAFKVSSPGLRRADLTNFLRFASLAALRTVLTLSLRIFLIADFSNGITEKILTYSLVFAQVRV